MLYRTQDEHVMLGRSESSTMSIDCWQWWQRSRVLQAPSTGMTAYRPLHGQSTLGHVLGREELCGNRQIVRLRRGGRIDGTAS